MIVSVVVLVLVAGFVTWRSLTPAPARADRCEVVGLTTGETYAMSPEQLLNASIITDVAIRRGLPVRAVVIALAVAQQESKLRNLSYGDADSVGLFQQRPSQGWGSRETLLIPAVAAGKFFDALVKVPNWQHVPLAQAAQAVQHSAFPNAYADWEPRATALAAALTGQTLGQLTCRLAHSGVHAAIARDIQPGVHLLEPGADATAAAAALRSALATELDLTAAAPVGHGRTAALSVPQLGGPPQPKSLDSPATGAAAAHRAATVANWLIARSAYYGVTEFSLGSWRWQAAHGWTTVPSAHSANGAASVTVSVTIRE